MTDAQTVIHVQNLVKRFGAKTAVNGVSLTVNRGEVYGFLGPNGSGKTTTIRMLCGLLRPDEGGGTCLGFDLLSNPDAVKKEVGYMAQHFSLYGDLTVLENLDFIARLYGVKGRSAAVRNIVARMKLEPYRDQLAGTLSGGWKQHLALACCLIHQPKLLLLDEPTAGVDPKARRNFWDQIHQLSTQGIAVLISTHYMDEAVRCNRLAYIAQGQLLTAGRVGEVIARENLTTWSVTGENLFEAAERLRGRPGVSQATFFGDVLRVSGHDPDALEAAIQPLINAGYVCRPEETGLEEVFISLMNRAEESAA